MVQYLGKCTASMGVKLVEYAFNNVQKLYSVQDSSIHSFLPCAACRQLD